MKFLYVDESGLTQEDPYLVFVGVLVDGYRLKKTMRDARPVLDAIATEYPGDLNELKSSRLVNGRGRWREVDADRRKELFTSLCGFVADTGAHVYMYVLDKAKYLAAAGAGNLPGWAPTEWRAGATPLCMFVQRDHNSTKNNKGLTVLIFDDNRIGVPPLCEFLLTSSDDVDEYYERGRRDEPFNQIIDTAFAIKSDHSRLVQISDACAFALRRRAEIELAGSPEDWPGELGFYRDRVASFAGRVKFPSKTWVTNPHCDAAEAIKDLGITNLNRWVTGR